MTTLLIQQLDFMTAMLVIHPPSNIGNRAKLSLDVTMGGRLKPEEVAPLGCRRTEEANGRNIIVHTQKICVKVERTA